MERYVILIHISATTFLEGPAVERQELHVEAEIRAAWGGAQDPVNDGLGAVGIPGAPPRRSPRGPVYIDPGRAGATPLTTPPRVSAGRVRVGSRTFAGPRAARKPRTA